MVALSIHGLLSFEKFRLFRKINSESEEFEEKFWKSKSAETFYNSLPANLENPMALLFRDSMQTLLKAKTKSNLNERMSNMLEVNIEKQIVTLEKGFTFFGNSRIYRSIYRVIWNSLGNNEFISVDCNFKKYKFGNCSTWNSRGFICNRIRFCWLQFQRLLLIINIIMILKNIHKN